MDKWMHTGLRNSQHFIETRLKADLKEKSHRFDFCFLIFCAVCSLRSVVSELWFHVFSMWLLFVCDWFVTCCLCVTCTYDFYLIYLCVCDVIRKSVISPTCFSVRFAMLSMWIIIIADVFKCVCVCACVFFFDMFKLYQFVRRDLCVCAVDNELFHSLFVSQMPILIFWQSPGPSSLRIIIS